MKLGSVRGVEIVGTPKARSGGSLESEKRSHISHRSAWNSPEVINIIARGDICGRMWANSVHTCIVTRPWGANAAREHGETEEECKEGWRSCAEGVGAMGKVMKKGAVGCQWACRAGPRHAKLREGRGGDGEREGERLERWKERGGQPDKQNPCCFISARLARHRPFIHASFRPTLTATTIPILPRRWTRRTPVGRCETNGTFCAILLEFVN